MQSLTANAALESCYGSGLGDDGRPEIAIVGNTDLRKVFDHQLAFDAIVPVAGDIKLMPGTASDPAYRRIDVDTKTGKVTGLF